jgi:hypothetical protein
MEYISLSGFDISELVVSIKISWKRVAANRETTEPRFPIGQVNKNPAKNRGGLSCSGWVSSSCSTSGTNRATIVTNLAMNEERNWSMVRFLAGFLLLDLIISFLCIVFYIVQTILLFFFFSHCIVCPSIDGFWLPLWYLQTLLIWRPLLRKSFEVMTSTWPIGNLGSVVSLLAATLFHDILIETTSSGMSDQRIPHIQLGLLHASTWTSKFTVMSG